MDSIIQPGRTPFRVGVTDAEIVPHAAWQAAREQVLDLLDAGTARIAILGLPGTGKSLLLRDLVDTIKPGTVHVLDDADSLDSAELEALPGAIPYVLAGRPGLAERLAGLHPPLAIVRLNPLSAGELTHFVAARLVAAGQPRDLLTPEAITALASHSGGVPRLINVLASAAIFAAELEGVPRVTTEHVAAATQMREPDTAPVAVPTTASPVLETQAAATQASAIACAESEGAPCLVTGSAAEAAPLPAPRATVPLAPRPAPARSRLPALWCGAALVLLIAAWAIGYSRHSPALPAAPAVMPSPATVARPALPALAPTPARPTSPMPRPPMPAPAIASAAPRAPAAVAHHFPRVVIQARPGNAELNEIAALLTPTYGLVERRLVAATPRVPEIRYFFRDDAAAAYALAATLDRPGLRWHVQSFTGYRPLPRPGTLEIWIP